MSCSSFRSSVSRRTRYRVTRGLQSQHCNVSAHCRRRALSNLLPTTAMYSHAETLDIALILLNLDLVETNDVSDILRQRIQRTLSSTTTRDVCAVLTYLNFRHLCNRRPEDIDLDSLSACRTTLVHHAYSHLHEGEPRVSGDTSTHDINMAIHRITKHSYSRRNRVRWFSWEVSRSRQCRKCQRTQIPTQPRMCTGTLAMLPQLRQACVFHG